MTKPIIAGNWKMFKTEDEAVQFAYQVSEKMPSIEVVDSVICAPFISLKSLVKCQRDNLRIGAQNGMLVIVFRSKREKMKLSLTLLGVHRIR